MPLQVCDFRGFPKDSIILSWMDRCNGSCGYVQTLIWAMNYTSQAEYMIDILFILSYFAKCNSCLKVHHQPPSWLFLTAFLTQQQCQQNIISLTLLKQCSKRQSNNQAYRIRQYQKISKTATAINDEASPSLRSHVIPFTMHFLAAKLLILADDYHLGWRSSYSRVTIRCGNSSRPVYSTYLTCWQLYI